MSADAVVVGSGPNGLVAALMLARAGRKVLLLEAAERFGGGLRSAEVTLPGRIHDLGATVMVMALASPAFRELAPKGVEFAHPPVALAHPLDGRPAVLVHRDARLTAAGLDGGGRAGLEGDAHDHDAGTGRIWPGRDAGDAGRIGHDGRAWLATVGAAARAGFPMTDLLFKPLGPWPLSLPAFARAARFGLAAALPATTFARRAFRGVEARALLAGISAHAMIDLRWPISAGYGLMLGALAHLVGWPVVRGGSQVLADALVAELRSLGGEAVAGHRVRRLSELDAPTIVLDVTPRQLLAMADLPAGYRRRLERYRYGPGVFKMDWALDGPVPWRDPAVAGAGTVHLGGTLEEIVLSEAETLAGRHSPRPYVLLVQPYAADPTRGGHTLYAYCHVPNGSGADMTDAIETQIERYAPGFRDRVLARHVMGPAELEAANPNLVGGDIGGGLASLGQFLRRPVWSPAPWRTPLPGVFLCSSSTPPGPAAHGMGGWQAARHALRARY